MIKNTICAFAKRINCPDRRVIFISFILPVLIAVLSVSALWQVNPYLVPEKISPEQIQGFKHTVVSVPGYNGLKPLEVVTFNLHYRFNYSAYQNSAVVIALPEFLSKNEYSLNSVWVNSPNDEQLKPEKQINTAVVKTERAFNLKPYIHEGENSLVLNITINPKWISSVSAYPMLYGADNVSTALCMIFLGSLAFLLFGVARAMRLDVPTSVIASLGMLYLSWWLFSFGSLVYTSDLPGHLAYTYHMAASIWANPYIYRGHEEFHPPLYYFFTARLFTFFLYTPINPITVLRISSLVFYSMFILYGLRTLSIAVASRRPFFYIGVLLFTFWPVGILRATNINNDVLVYMIWAMSFYYMVDWFNTKKLGSLQKAIALVGVLFMIKSNAWVLLGILGVLGLYGLYTRRISWKDLFHENTLLASGVLLSGIIINFGRIIYYLVAFNNNMSRDYFGSPREDYYPLSYFVNFDFAHYMRHPFVVFKQEPGFFHYFLKSSLFTERGAWGWEKKGIYLILPPAMNFLLLCVVFLTFLGIALRFKAKRTFDSLFPYFSTILLCVLASMMFTYFDRYVFCQNFRYVLPVLAPFIILYTKSMETLCDSTILLRPVYWLGCLAGLALPAIGIALFIAQ